MPRKSDDPVPTRVAVLGGGTAALTAALALTDPARSRRCDVTVYQMGWRLGGKGASGRNADRHQRIEEHGIHVWFGFYENAFRVMRAVYDELAAARPPDAPARAINRCDDDAFIPHDDFVLNEQVDGETWVKWVMRMPTNDLVPGDGAALPSSASPAYLRLAALQTALWPFERDFHRRETAVPLIADPIPANPAEAKLLHYIRNRPRGHLESNVAPDNGQPEPTPLRVVDFLDAALDLIGLPDDELGFLDPGLESATADRGPVGRLPLRLAALSSTLGWGRNVARAMDVLFPADHVVHRYYLTLDTFAAIVTGVADDIFRSGKNFSDLDDEDLRKWLLRHGADARYIHSNPSVRFVYNSAFSFDGGKHDQPRIAAGAALKAILRVFMTYKGSLAYRMTSGMGDIVFGPIYEVLKKRGVKFKFFHRVDGLGLVDDPAGEPAVGRIQLTRQVPFAGAGVDTEYHPLVNVKGLPSWPDRPLFEQLRNGQHLAGAVKAGLNLEDPTARWQDQQPVTLEWGRDFDAVVLGIPVAALKTICPEIERHPRIGGAWRAMLDGVSTTPTQAFQVWFNGDLERLGWTGTAPIFGTYVDPIDTYVDMTPALAREERPEGTRGSLAYFCGVIDDQPHETWGDAQARAARNAVSHLAGRCGHIWPGLVGSAGIDWNLMAGASGHTDEERFSSQYSRANVLPSERYTLALPGTTKFRLAPGGSGCQNLWLAGDWTANPINLGCVEATVMSGLLAARAMTGDPIEIIGETDDFLWRGIGLPPPTSGRDNTAKAGPATAAPRAVPKPDRPPPGWENEFVEQLGNRVAAFDRAATAELCQVLVRRIRHADDVFPAQPARRVLSLLRRKRWLDLLQTVAEALIQSGQDTPQVRRQYAQALVDQGNDTAAFAVLETLRTDARCDQEERDEVSGLVGRIHKQRFIDADSLGPRQRGQALQAAIAAYGDPYRSNPTRNLWHGINLVALLARARCEGFALPALPPPRDLATNILGVIQEKSRRGPLDAWDAATAAEACVALEDYPRAFKWIREYVKAPGADAFELTSTLRQLTEVWRLDADVEPGETLLRTLHAHLLRRAGGSIAIAAKSVRADLDPWFSNLEARLGVDEMTPLAWYRMGLERCRLVGRIENKFGVGVGTGFLVRAGDFLKAADDPDELVLLTCAHVLRDGPTAGGVLGPRDAVVKFEALETPGGTAMPFGVERVLWSSMTRPLDATLARLSPRARDAVRDLSAYPMAAEAPDPERRQRVYLLGHPNGGPLFFSLHDNLLIAFDDPRVIYRAPTEPGSSGSPVFNDQWELTAIHRGAGEGHAAGRVGNEGIWIEAVRQASLTGQTSASM